MGRRSRRDLGQQPNPRERQVSKARNARLRAKKKIEKAVAKLTPEQMAELEKELKKDA